MFQKVTPFLYNLGYAPPEYTCSQCGKSGVKLWRDYQICLQEQELVCCSCAAASQGKDLSSMDKDGRYLSNSVRTDQIGWLVPAVPTQDGETLWSYTSVPEEGVDWWRNLPNGTS